MGCCIIPIYDKFDQLTRNSQVPVLPRQHTDDAPSGLSLRVRDAVHAEATKLDERIKDVDFISRHGVSIFVSVTGAMFSVMVLLGTYIYGVESRVKNLEVMFAESRGVQQSILDQVRSISSGGSATAQRTEVVVTEMSTRLAKLEDFMARGPRFTAEDGARLERRLERLEGLLATSGPKGKQ